MIYSKFQGFPKECPEFYIELKKNNDKNWFEQHKSEYEANVLNPSKAFVITMGELLRKIAPGIHAEPKVNKSLFRINRDTRFSRDKSPYKTNMGIWLWEGHGKRMECSGFYFHLEPPVLMLGCGIYMFPKELLEKYRQRVIHEIYGPQLISAVKEVTDKGSYELGGKYYKKVPKGFDPRHKLSEFLLYNGLHINAEMDIPDAFYTEELPDFCYNIYKDMLAIHKWLLELTEKD